MNKPIILFVVAIVVIAGASFYFFKSPALAPITNPVACTMEAKLCPDGSAVGRTGPNCEFALCPTGSVVPPVSQNSGVSGVVTLGPVCPVERIPPDPNCAPRFYSTSIAIYEAGHTNVTKIIQSDSSGIFSTELDPGNYTLEAKGGNTLPRCGNVSATVKSGQYTKVEISCDTGIR